MNIKKSGAFFKCAAEVQIFFFIFLKKPVASNLKNKEEIYNAQPAFLKFANIKKAELFFLKQPAYLKLADFFLKAGFAASQISFFSNFKKQAKYKKKAKTLKKSKFKIFFIFIFNKFTYLGLLRSANFFFLKEATCL
jgi:hypothetical protein